jgi:DNA-binding transcriptional LysR family regulator
MLDVRKLVMLRAIAAEGSIAAAGRALRYTRSAVSQQLTALENEAGTALINRAGNRVTLTPAGHTLVEHAERILAELRAAEAMLSSNTAGITGLLRVGVPFREGPRIMIRALTEVRRRFPDMEIRLAATTDETGADAVRRDQLDMVIVSRYGVAHPRTAPGLREWVLGHDALRLCVPADNPLASAQSCTMTQLRDESWIVCPATTLGQLTMSLCTTAGFEPRVTATVNDIGTAIDLVGFGWGITVAPELTPVDTEAKLARIPIDGLDTVRHNVVIVRDGEHLSPRIAAAIAAVRAVSSELPTGCVVSEACGEPELS